MARGAVRSQGLCWAATQEVTRVQGVPPGTVASVLSAPVRCLALGWDFEF